MFSRDCRLLLAASHRKTRDAFTENISEGPLSTTWGRRIQKDYDNVNMLHREKREENFAAKFAFEHERV